MIKKFNHLKFMHKGNDVLHFIVAHSGNNDDVFTYRDRSVKFCILADETLGS